MKQVIHINPNEIEHFSQLGTWIINFLNYDVRLSEGVTDTTIPMEQYQELKAHIDKLNQIINGIDNQIAIQTNRS